MSKNKRLFLILFWSLFTGHCLVFFGGCENKEKGKKEEEKITPVKITKVKRGNIKEIISLTGDIHGEKEVNVYAKVPGKLIKKIKNAGDYVKEGDIIALIDRDEPAMDFSLAEVKSPIDGIVTMYFSQPGEAVFPAQPMPREPVVMVACMDQIKVVVYLSEIDIGKVKKGQSAQITISAYPNKTFSGIITEVAPAANPMTRKLKTEITVSNPGHLLKPGTFARVEIIIKEHKNILLVPRLSILEIERGKVVFIVENNRAKMINVLTGTEDEENIEIKEGLEENQDVIIEGNYGLIDGTQINIVRELDG